MRLSTRAAASIEPARSENSTFEMPHSVSPGSAEAEPTDNPPTARTAKAAAAATGARCRVRARGRLAERMVAIAVSMSTSSGIGSASTSSRHDARIAAT
jgi:hypothetical protein